MKSDLWGETMACLNSLAALVEVIMGVGAFHRIFLASEKSLVSFASRTSFVSHPGAPSNQINIVMEPNLSFSDLLAKHPVALTTLCEWSVTNAACESCYTGGIERVSVRDPSFPSLQCLPFHVLIPETIAKHADCGNGGISLTYCLIALVCGVRAVLTTLGLPT